MMHDHAIGEWLDSNSTTPQFDGVIQVGTDEKAVLEQTFDDCKETKTADLRPSLPRVLKY